MTELTIKLQECPIFGIHDITDCRKAKIKKVSLIEWAWDYIYAQAPVQYVGLGFLVMVGFGVFLFMV